MTAPWEPEPPAAPGESLPADHAPAPRRRGLVVALVLSLVAVVGLTVPLALLATARAAWEGQNAELRARVDALTDQVSARNARIAELEDVEDQLATLKEDYSAAVNAGATGTETVAELTRLIDSFERCVEAQQDHFAILRDAERYTAASVAASERSIVEFCDSVSEAYAEFDARE